MDMEGKIYLKYSEFLHQLIYTFISQMLLNRPWGYGGYPGGYGGYWG
jgi:hypothetical protein